MAWDDAPPDADNWDATAPTPEELKPSYMEDVGSNALKEVKAIPGSLPGMAKAGLGIADLPLDALKAVPQMMGGKDLADTDVAEDIKPVIEGNKSTINTLAHPVDSFRKAPINTAGTIAGLLGAAKAGISGAGEKIPEPAVAEAPPGPLPAEEGLRVIEPGSRTGDPHALFAYNDDFGPGGAQRSVYNIYGDPQSPAMKGHGWGSSVPQGSLGEIPVAGREPGSAKYQPLDKINPLIEKAEPIVKQGIDKAKEVQNYISNGYEGFAKKPGAITDLADYVQEKSQMMSAQQMGFTPLQNRQLGSTPTQQMEAMRAIGQYGLDAGIVSPAGGLRHMVETNARLLNETGETLSTIRKAADQARDPKLMPMDPLQEIRAKWDPVFAGAERSDELPQYERAVKIVQEHPATFEGMADAATALNKAANKANKLNQPHTAFTDVANTIGQVENPRIRQLLPEKAAAYDQALKAYGINKKIEAGLRRKVGGEVKRMGPGSLTSNMAQKALDEVGYRVGARAANKLATTIKGRPGIAKSLPSLFKEFANHVDETAGEVSGMYQGGTVPDDVKQWISTRSC